MGYKLKRATIRVNNSRGLPAEYQEVEWIQSSNGVYIDTGFKPNNNSRFVADYQVLERGAAPMGCYNNPSNYGMVINTDGGAYMVGLHYGTTYYGNTGVNFDTRKKADLNKNVFSVDDVVVHTFTAQTFQMNINCWIFGWNRDGTQSNSGSLKLWSSQIYDDGTLVRDFVPCYRIADGEIGLYDLVNDVFYTNSGTGTFTKGNDVPDMVEKQVRPTTSIYEISYDLRDGTLAGLESAGFTGISTNGGYAFDANGLYQTSSSNDRGTAVYKDGLDLSNATKITIQSLGYWERGSWTNDKYVGIKTTQNTNPSLIGWIRLNTNSGSKDGGIGYYNASGTMTLSNITQQDRYSGDTTMTLVIDLENKVIDYNTSGTNVGSWTLSITDAIVAEIRSMQFIYLGWNRGYHTFDANERLKEVYIKIE